MDGTAFHCPFYIRKHIYHDQVGSRHTDDTNLKSWDRYCHQW